MLIYLDEYRKAKAAARARQEEERECIYAATIATVSAVFCFKHPGELSPVLPEDLTFVDIDQLLLDRIHALASQF